MPLSSHEWVEFSGPIVSYHPDIIGIHEVSIYMYRGDFETEEIEFWLIANYFLRDVMYKAHVTQIL